MALTFSQLDRGSGNFGLDFRGCGLELEEAVADEGEVGAGQVEGYGAASAAGTKI